MNHEEYIIHTFLLGYQGWEMKDLPDLMKVHEGVDIRIDLGHIIAGWTLVGKEVVSVWFIKITDGSWQKFG